MNCDCITKAEAAITENQVKFKGRHIETARIRSVLSMSGGKLKRRPSIIMALSVQGLKSLQSMDIAYSYCPFCGKQLETTEDADHSESANARR